MSAAHVECYIFCFPVDCSYNFTIIRSGYKSSKIDHNLPDSEASGDETDNLTRTSDWSKTGQKHHSKSRRRRTAFTSEQLLELEREFHAKKYLSLTGNSSMINFIERKLSTIKEIQNYSTERSQIANSLKLTEVQVI